MRETLSRRLQLSQCMAKRAICCNNGNPAGEPEGSKPITERIVDNIFMLAIILEEE